MPLFLVRRSLLRGTPKASRNRCFCSSFVGRRLSPSCLIPNPPVLSDLLKEFSVYPFVMTTILLLEQSKYSPGEYIVLLLCESSRHCQINSYSQHRNSHENPELICEMYSKKGGMAHRDQFCRKPAHENWQAMHQLGRQSQLWTESMRTSYPCINVNLKGGSSHAKWINLDK
jgi:hypothetical protein